jgi:NhaA family Na+:H+ antiporter
MTLLGKRVPLPLKVFLTALAIVDDIGAVLIIALFYTSGISLIALKVAGIVMLLLIFLNVTGVRRLFPYLFLGVILWIAFLKSGVHATVAGVLLAFTIPTSMRIKGMEFVEFAKMALDVFKDKGGDSDNIMTNPTRQSAVHALEEACELVQTPLIRLEHKLHTVVAFFIMPVFALANAGVSLGDGLIAALTSSVGLGVMLGLIIGKQVGVVTATVIVVKSAIGKLPTGCTWKQVYSTGWLAGIGFTMSLFIANLAFGNNPELLNAAKIGILSGSLIAGVVGFVLLKMTTAPKKG